VPISDMLAFAAMRLHLGHELDVVREELGLDADQLALVRQRLRTSAKPAAPKRQKPKRGRPPVAGWR
jgi:hypothetical protein